MTKLIQIKGSDELIGGKFTTPQMKRSPMAAQAQNAKCQNAPAISASASTSDLNQRGRKGPHTPRPRGAQQAAQLFQIKAALGERIHNGY
jgi:hypothetical protein